MTTRLFALLLLAPCAVLAQDMAGDGKGKKQVFDAEVFRRGDSVQRLGVWSADPDAVVLDALSPPPDDSHKWFITVLTKDKDVACETLKRDFNTHKALHSWIAEGDDKAWAHYRVIRVEDPTQKDWFRHIKYEKLPLLLVQPPANGKYGSTEAVVVQSEGYDGDAEKLNKLIRERITSYVAKNYPNIQKGGPNTLAFVEQRPVPVSLYNGHVSQDETSDAGRSHKPPFGEIAQKVDPYVADGPFLNPPTPVVRELTLAEIQAACPNAPPDFLLAQLAKKPTDINAVRLEWMLYQQQRPVTPTPGMGPLLTLILSLFGGGTGIGLVIMGLQLWRTLTTAMGRKPLLDDAQFQRLLDTLRGLGYQITPPPSPPPVTVRAAAVQSILS